LEVINGQVLTKTINSEFVTLHHPFTQPIWILEGEYHTQTPKLRATLHKGPRTNLKEIESWIGPFFTLKEITFSYSTMSVSKGLGSNSRVQYQKCVLDMWED
jgi:hypothetical protein